MAVIEETDASLILSGVNHRLKGTRHDPGQPWEPVPVRDWALVLDVTLGGALLDEVDRLALARWLLVGIPYAIYPEEGPE